MTAESAPVETSQAAPDAAAPVDPTKLEDVDEVAYFADLKRAENEAREQSPEAKPEKKPEAKPETKGKADAKGKPEINAERVAQLLREGKFDEAAKEAGADLKASEWSKKYAEFRNQESLSKHKLKAREDAIAKRESEVAAIVEQTKGSAANILKAAECVKERDWVRLLEVASGEPIDTILKEMTDQAVDPSSRQMRKYQAERDEERRKNEETQRQLAERQAKERQEQQYSAYKANLAQRLAGNESLAKHKDHETFNVLVDQVFNWQLEHAKDYDHLDQADAQKQADADAIDAIRKTIKIQADRWSRYLDDVQQTVEGESGANSTTKPEQHGAPKSVTRSISKSQGTGTQGRPLTPEEEDAEFARMLRAENLAKRQAGVRR